MNLEYFKNSWDFELLDTGLGMRLEKWGQVILARPDPQIIWQKSLPDTEWSKAWATFKPAQNNSKGHWDIKTKIPAPWIIKWGDVSFLLKLSPFKHTGIFAEQAANWEWMTNKVQKAELKTQNPKLKILNLFAYTGGATMVLAKAGCHVTHVDASKPSLTWANENYKLNNLSKDSVRWMLDDCAKFVKRELKRGVKYDGIIMDPPAFGHSPTGKTWLFNVDLPELLADCVNLLSDNAQFLLINAYATNSSSLALNNTLEDTLQKHSGKIDFGELCLKQKNQRVISTGIFTKWSK